MLLAGIGTVQFTVALFLKTIVLPELFTTAVPAGRVSICEAVLQEKTTTKSVVAVVAVAVREVYLKESALPKDDAPVAVIDVGAGGT